MVEVDSKVNSGTLRMSNPLNKKERTKDRYGALSDSLDSLLPEGICQIIPSIKELATLQEDHKIDKKQETFPETGLEQLSDHSKEIKYLDEHFRFNRF